MIRSGVWPLTVILFASLAASTQASVIPFSARASNLPVIGTTTTPPFDLSQGGTFSLGSPQLIGDQYTALWWTHNSVPIDGSVAVDVMSLPTPGLPAGVSYSAQIMVPIHGDIHGDGLTSDLQGGYSGTGASARSFYTPGTVLPQDLVDLLAHPERIHLNAITSGGHNNFLVTSLTIDGLQPAPVPEPSVLCVLVVGLGGAAIRRMKRRRILGAS
jgi:hypothetical protein